MVRAALDAVRAAVAAAASQDDSDGSAQTGYADAASCAVCHAEIARSYALTGMARSFSRVDPAQAIADFKTRNRVHHAASARHYTMLERGGALVSAAS